MRWLSLRHYLQSRISPKNCHFMQILPARKMWYCKCFRIQFPALSTHSPSPFIPSSQHIAHLSFVASNPFWDFPKHRCLPCLFFLIPSNETSCPVAMKGETGKGPSLITLQTVVVRAISVTCSITIEHLQMRSQGHLKGSLWSSKSVSCYFDLVWGYNPRSIWPTLALIPNLISAIWNV